MNRIFPPQGSLGDCFVLAGAANYFSQNSDHLYFPILNRGNQYETVKCLFKDNPKITVIGFVDPHYSDLNEFIILNQLDMIPVPDILSVDINGVVTQPIWDEQHYTLFDIPFKYRYSKFQMPAVDQEAAELFEKTVTQSRYILASKKYGSANNAVEIDLITWRNNRGLDPLEEFQIIELTEELSNNMLYYLKLIEHAEEIHCVPSSVFCFVDSISSKTNAKLFYHNLRKQTLMRINNPWNQFRWNIIHYDRQL